MQGMPYIPDTEAGVTYKHFTEPCNCLRQVYKGSNLGIAANQYPQIN